MFGQLIAIGLYFSLLFVYALGQKRTKISQQDFILGNRSLNRWSTAMAAHASDMSNWLFMAYPGMVFLKGGAHIWAAIGLVLMMWLNWMLVAPRLRKETEKTESVTITGFFEQKLGRSWPRGRLTISLFLFLFYTVYVAVMLVGMGVLIQTLFPVSYSFGVFVGALLILPYILVGGYKTLARIDLLQGIFLLAVIFFVPIYITNNLGGFSVLKQGVQSAGMSFSLFTGTSIWGNLFLMLGWGIGYFGQPHILTKFMGIKNPLEMKDSRRIGMTWQILTLGAASFVGFVGIAVFSQLENSEHVFIELVRSYFSPFVSTLFLCAVLAAIINAISSMLLVLSSTVVEDIYVRFFRKNCSDQEQLFVSRIAIILSISIGLWIALLNFATLDGLVFYAWSGLGAIFGPLVLSSLYFKKITSKGAWLGVITGGGLVALWPLLRVQTEVLPFAFPLALTVIYFTSRKQEALTNS